jgi:5-hydroxyisourate hydrolase
MPGLSIHVVDVSRGVVAAGMKVELFALAPARRLLVIGDVSDGGLLESKVLDMPFESGEYEAVFHVADWYRAQGVTLPEIPFLSTVVYRFGVGDSRQHYHLPFKCTPWGYSCFRGGK